MFAVKSNTNSCVKEPDVIPMDVDYPALNDPDTKPMEVDKKYTKNKK